MEMRTHHCLGMLWLSLTLLLSPWAQGREFTNTDGKKMQAEPLGMAAGKVIFVKADGSKFAYDLHKLCEADRVFLKEWAKTPRYPLTVSKVENVMVGKRRNTSIEPAKSYEESRAYEVTLKSSSDQPIKGLVCCYALFPKRNDRSAKSRRNTLEPSYGKVSLKEIRKEGKITFRTKPVILRSMDLSTEDFEEEGLEDPPEIVEIHWNESLAGANFNFYHNGKIVATHHLGKFKDQGTPPPEDLEEDPAEDDSK